jgi:hypothetical protein
MTDIQRFNKYWVFDGQRANQTKTNYENVLFSIWKNHPDWNEKEGFQINCDRDRTIYNVVEMAQKAGLLQLAKNYFVGHHTRYFHKNFTLFDTIYRNADNLYGKWLNSKKNDVILSNSLNKLKEANEDKKLFDAFVGLKSVVTKSKKLPKLSYDLQKLTDLSKTMLPHYYKLMMKLNDAAIGDDLKLITFIHFTDEGLPSGRPYSKFCNTLNPKKNHKVIDTSIEERHDFLMRMGIPDYYEVFDIKSEFPRVNYLFHTGIWKPDDYDFYTEIINDTEMLKYTGDAIPRGETKYTDREDSMKQLFMRVYFGKGSDKQSYGGYSKERKKRNENDGLFEDMLNNGQLVDYNVWKVICESTRKVVGQPIGNLIMWYSFFIETEIKIELLKRGKTAYNVYDGFYYNADIKDEIIDILNEKAIVVYNKCMKPIKRA